ncbi:hypothetical protein [Rhodosalinus sp. FB01]|uniref:hypothetical protein n=1 Tax=Rhodosalinus sp. FB01 TaxID=3239194 RepID=UPI003523D55E
MTHNDLFARFVRALPAYFIEASVEELVDAQSKADPAYWSQPLDAAAAAEFLGTTTGALATKRSRGEGAPWSMVDGRIIYPSRLELLKWVRARMAAETKLKRADHGKEVGDV